MPYKRQEYNDFVNKTASSQPTPQPTPQPSHAYGLSYVPYDNYSAVLHQGERVLTASQNREYSSGVHGGVSVTVNGLVVREDADVDRIAEELYVKLMLANSNYSNV